MSGKKWKIPKDEIYYSNSEGITLKGDLEIGGTLIIGFKDNSQNMQDARDVLGTSPVRHHQSESRSKRRLSIIQDIILFSFKRVLKENGEIPFGIAQDVWDKISDLHENDDFDRDKLSHSSCIKYVSDTELEYSPYPIDFPKKTKTIKRINFDSILSRLRKNHLNTEREHNN